MTKAKTRTWAVAGALKDQASEHEIDKLPEYRRKLRRLERRQRMVRTSSILCFLWTGFWLAPCGILMWAMYEHYLTSGLAGGLIAFGLVLVPLMFVLGFAMIGYVFAFFTGHDPSRAKAIFELKRLIGQLEELLGDSLSRLAKRRLLSNIDAEGLVAANLRRLEFRRSNYAVVIAFLVSMTLGFRLFYSEWPLLSLITGSETSVLPHIVFNVLFLLIAMIAANDVSHGFSRYLKDNFYQELMARIGVDYRQSALFLPTDVADHGVLDTHSEFFCDEAFGLTYHNRRIDFQECSNRSLPKNLEPRIIEKETVAGQRLRKNSLRRTRGVMARIELRRPLQSQTIIYANTLEQKFRRDDFQTIRLLNGELEKRYTVQSPDQVESRYIFDPYFMEKFLRLAEHLGTDRIVASFKGKELLLLSITNKDHFEAGYLNEPLVPESFEPLFRHVMIYQEIVDTLELAPNRGL